MDCANNWHGDIVRDPVCPGCGVAEPRVVMVRWEGDAEWTTIECTPEEFAGFKALVDAPDECGEGVGDEAQETPKGRSCVCGCGEVRYR